jgi:Trypsin
MIDRARYRSVAFQVFALLGFVAPLGAAILPTQAAADEVVMIGSTNSAAGTTQIDGGSKQDLAAWPATLKYFVSNNFTCTSTIVGEHTVITAAHCLPEGTSARVEIGGTKFNLNCARHPLFNKDTLETDVALCFSKDIFPQKIAFENLDLRITRVAVGSVLFLLGYGCRDVTSQIEFGQLYGGSATVSQLASGTSSHMRTRDGVVICPGDSGGSAYVLATMDEPISPRSIVGINSGYAALSRVSAITPLTGIVAEFIRDWCEDHKTTICGVHANVSNCHDRFSP